MKTLYIEQPKRQKYAHLFMGGIFMLQGILQLSHNDSGVSFWLGLTLLIFSISLLLYTIVTFKPESKNIPRIGLGKREIALHWGIFSKKKTIPLGKVKLIQLKPERLTVMTNEYDFSYSISYDGNNKDFIRKEIEAYAEDQKLPLEKVRYRNV